MIKSLRSGLTAIGVVVVLTLVPEGGRAAAGNHAIDAKLTAFALRHSDFRLLPETNVLAGKRRGCHDAHTEDWGDPGTWDPDLECMDSLQEPDMSTAMSAINDIGGSGFCGTIKFSLQSESPLMEWTGTYATSYTWVAATRYDLSAIGVNHSYMGDSGLWTHEGAHYEGEWDEGDAEYWREHCMLIPPAPSPLSVKQEAKK